MFKCIKCVSTFTRKDNLKRHEKTHDKVCFPCLQCSKSFSYQSNLVRHMKNTHNRVRRDNTIIAPQVQDVQRCEVEIAPNRTDQPSGLEPTDMPSDYFNDGNDEMCVEVLKNAESAGLCNTKNYVRVRTPDEKEIAPGIYVPDIPAGPSWQYTNNMPSDYFNDGNDEMCVEVLKNAESAGLCNTNSYMATVGGKRVHVENTASRIKSKKARMDLVNKLGFVEVKSAHRRKIVWYYAKNLNNFENYISFFQSLKIELGDLLKSIVTISPIKFNLKLEATYSQPNVENSSQNRSFKTSARPIFIDSDITLLIDEAFTALLHEEEIYAAKGSGYVLESIDGLLLTVYKYTPMGDTPNIQIPIRNIDNENNIDNNNNNNNTDNNTNNNTDNNTNNIQDNSSLNEQTDNYALAGSSYIKLPPSLINKRATINPQNNDQYCFKWAILAKHVTGPNKHRVGENYYQHESKYDFTGLSFPTPWCEVKIFEKNNPGVSVNIYGVKKISLERSHVYPIKVVDDEKANHFDIILFSDGEKSHYVYISNFSRLIRSQTTLHGHSVYYCKRCFTSFDNQNLKYKSSGQLALKQHKLICGSHKPILPIMPEVDTTLEFKAWGNAQRHPFAIYGDFEALLIKTDERKGENTTIIHRHKPMSYGFVVKASEDVPLELIEKFNIPTSPVIYRGSGNREEVARHFVNSIVEVGLKIEELLKTNVPICMSDEDTRRHNENNQCNLCKCILNKNDKVRDHCHLSGKFRQTLCSKCNISLQQPKFVPCFFHNLTNYDAHFIVTELGYDAKTIKVIPNSEEKFITFSKYISKSFTIRFVDTCRFMATKLENLAKNLMTPDFSKFCETSKHFSDEDMPLVTRKGIYPYEYTDDWSKLEQTTLPPMGEFYSSLTEKNIEDSEYQFAAEVWDHFGCRTLGEYSDLYLKIDVLLLADIFENFRDVCMKAYNLDPAYYFTAPAYSFDAMLKQTGIKLELLTDYDMLLMFENGIRGGLVQASMRYAKANNYKIPDFDPTKPKSWLVYQDCNNLYGWAMSQYMPYGSFNWVEPTLNGLNDLDDTSPIGRIYEVDVTYPENLHDLHNDLPFLPQNGIPVDSKVRKLMATFETKKNYIVHYRSLQQAIENGLIVNKVHRVIQFNQSAWLAEYIKLNTEMRKRALNDFEKDFFKLMNNAIFGKTMEQVRRRLKVELVSSDERLRKLINKTTFKHATGYNENLSAITLENKIIKFDKPIYIGLAVLDISKTLMYDYHYNVMKRYYGEKISLMYTDTDSLVYFIETDDFYEDMVNNPILLDRMDTANLPENHACYIAERKKIPGLFSDETNGDIMTEFCALRSKSYSYKIGIDSSKEEIRAKGVRGHVVKNHMTFEDHRRCLFEGMDSVVNRQPNISIRSFNHQLTTIRTNKITYNNYDDKRVVLEDKVHTLAHGHYSLEDAELVEIMADTAF